MVKNLSTWLEEYEQKHPDEVIHIEQEVSTRYEVTAFVRAFEKKNQYPILVFHKLATENGKPSKWRLITNILATRTRCAEIAGTTYDQVARYLSEKTTKERRKPIVVEKNEAPCKQVIMKCPQDISLFDIPVVRHHALDAGPFVTAGFFTVFDPETKIDNSSLHRGNVWEDNRTGINMSPISHAGAIFRKYEAMAKDMPAAYWVGHHPAAMISAQTRMALGESHFEAMGAVLGEPLRLVPSEAYGEDLLVPADAEFIFEGYLPALKRAPEGPFGEYPGYTGPQRWNPYFVITHITCRKDAIFHDITVGGPEHQITGCFGIETGVYNLVKQVVPTLKNVYMPVSGCCRFHVYLQIKKEREPDGREAIMAAMLADPRIKHVFAFDEDIDIFNEKKVLWAIATRTQWNEDLIIVPDCAGAAWDPTTRDSVTCKGGIDATEPLPTTSPFLLGNVLPKEIKEKINYTTLDNFISKEKVRKVPVTI